MDQFLYAMIIIVINRATMCLLCIAGNNSDHVMCFVDSYRIIRRRVIWLVGCWISVKMSPSLRPAVYESIISLLQPTEDIVIRLEAAQTLKFDILC